MGVDEAVQIEGVDRVRFCIYAIILHDVGVTGSQQELHKPDYNKPDILLGVVEKT